MSLAAGIKHQTYQDPDRLFDLSVSFDAGLSKRDAMNYDPVIQRSEGFLSKTVPVQILTGNNRLFKANNNRFFDVKFEEKLTGSTLSRDSITNKENDFHSVNPKIIQKLDFVSDNTVMKTLDGIVGDIDFVDKLNQKS